MQPSNTDDMSNIVTQNKLIKINTPKCYLQKYTDVNEFSFDLHIMTFNWIMEMNIFILMILMEFKRMITNIEARFKKKNTGKNNLNKQSQHTKSVDTKR